MAEAALRRGNDFDTDILRRIMARPLRVEPSRTTGASTTAPVVEIVHRILPIDATTRDTPIKTEPSGDSSKLRAEVLVMKAVLSAERRETADLRALVKRLDEPAVMSDEARAVRDRWAALVDRLLDAPR